MRAQNRSIVTIDTHARNIYKNIHFQHNQVKHYNKDAAPYGIQKIRRSEHYIILKGEEAYGF